LEVEPPLNIVAQSSEETKTGMASQVEKNAEDAVTASSVQKVAPPSLTRRSPKGRPDHLEVLRS